MGKHRKVNRWKTAQERFNALYWRYQWGQIDWSFWLLSKGLASLFEEDY